MASRLPDHMKLLPVGLAGEIHVNVLIDEVADEVTAVYFASGDLTLVLTADDLQELARAVGGGTASEAFSLSRHDDTFLVETVGNVRVSIMLDVDELAQFQTVLARVQGIIEP